MEITSDESLTIPRTITVDQEGSTIMRSDSIRFIISIAWFTAGLMGCAEIRDSGPQLDETEAAVGSEPGCATAALASPNGAVLVANANGARVASPDDKYNTPGCPYQFVAEVLGSVTSCSSYFAQWHQPMPTSDAACTDSRLQYHVYGYKNGAWTGAIYESRQAGSWNSGNGSCHFSEISATGSSDYSSYSKLRLAVQAWQWIGGQGDHKFVEVVCAALLK